MNFYIWATPDNVRHCMTSAASSTHILRLELDFLLLLVGNLSLSRRLLRLGADAHQQLVRLLVLDVHVLLLRAQLLLQVLHL